MATGTFSDREYAGRLSRFRTMMVDQHVDVAIVDDMETMIWLTGYRVTENLWRCCVIPLLAEPYLVLRSLDAQQAETQSWIKSIVRFRDEEDPVEVLVNQLGDRRLASANIGVDYDSYSMTPRRLARLRQLLPVATLTDISEAKYNLRSVKSDEEICHLGKAAALTDQAFQAAVRSVRIGRTQRDVAKAVAAAFYQLGFDDGSIGPLTTGADWDCLHGIISDAPLQKGSIVHVELVPRLGSYSARLMRSISVGRPSAEIALAMEALIDAQDQQFEALRPGVSAKAVDRVGREAVLRAGLRTTYDNITGYTLGIIPSGSPHTSDFERCFTPRSDWTVEEGMVFHMYLSARGLAISETVVVRSGGPVRLTTTDRKLFQID